MNLDTLSTAELYSEIADLARDQGVTSQDTWNQLCDDVLESHENLAELNDDQDIEQQRLALHDLWNEYSVESAPESANAISEDPEAPRAS